MTLILHIPLQDEINEMLTYFNDQKSAEYLAGNIFSKAQRPGYGASMPHI